MRANTHNILFLLIFFTCCLAGGQAAHGSESTLAYSSNQPYQNADRDFTHFSTEFFHHLAGRPQQQDLRSFELIIAEARHAFELNEPAYAVSLIIGHEQLLKSNLNSKDIINAENLLLRASEYNTAARYLTLIENESDPSIIANVQYAFANYYFARDRWNKTIDIISQIANDLPPLKYQHALLMQGICLQNLKEHRKALAVYTKIPVTSPDYVAARINMALANVRQGWWTDAYIILSGLLKRHDVIQDKALTDRLHTIIGYTFLQQEYYRNSRKAFRNVEISGPYTNQALLGIALDAGYQKDYIGALNAARILKRKQSHELQVDEANLLLPYFYEKLGQMATASAGYSDAIRYYQARLQALNAMISAGPDSLLHGVSPNKTMILINDEPIDLGETLPPAFFSQLTLLKSYDKTIQTISDPLLSAHYADLLKEFNNLIYQSVHSSLKKKVQYLTDYMNQSRYGLARLYDKNLSDSR